VKILHTTRNETHTLFFLFTLESNGRTRRRQFNPIIFWPQSKFLNSKFTRNSECWPTSFQVFYFLGNTTTHTTTQQRKKRSWISSFSQFKTGLAGTGTARRSSLTKLSPNIQLVVDVVVVVVTTGRIVACCWSPAQNVEQEKNTGHNTRDETTTGTRWHNHDVNFITIDSFGPKVKWKNVWTKLEGGGNDWERVRVCCAGWERRVPSDGRQCWAPTDGQGPTDHQSNPKVKERETATTYTHPKSCC
jgi:hypothetical protein